MLETMTHHDAASNSPSMLWAFPVPSLWNDLQKMKEQPTRPRNIGTARRKRVPPITVPKT